MKLLCLYIVCYITNMMSYLNYVACCCIYCMIYLSYVLYVNVNLCKFNDSLTITSHFPTNLKLQANLQKQVLILTVTNKDSWKGVDCHEH